MSKTKTLTHQPARAQNHRPLAARKTKPKKKPSSKKNTTSAKRTVTARVKVVKPVEPAQTIQSVSAAPLSTPPSPAAATLATPITPLPEFVSPTGRFKELPHPSERWPLWIAVMAATVIIFLGWLYLTQRKFTNLPSVVSDSFENAQVDTLVNDLQQNYTDLKNNMGELSTAANQTGATNTNTAANATNTNANAELNNLFSDLQ